MREFHGAVEFGDSFRFADGTLSAKHTVEAYVVLVSNALLVILLVALWRLRRRRRRMGPAAAGTVYEMLSEDRRKAIEIIIEERTGERDPEDKDGNLPDLAKGNG